MTAPILRITQTDAGSHHVVSGTRDFGQAHMLVDPDALDDPAVLHIANLLYDWPEALRTKPRKPRKA